MYLKDLTYINENIDEQKKNSPVQP